jgi:hypothetical protein
LFPERRFRLARQWSNRELRRLAPHFAGHVVNVSGWNDDDKEGGTYKAYFSAATGYTLTNYAGERGFGGRAGERLLDLSRAPAPELERAFDVAFNHTTLEHIFDVRQAFANLCRLSRDVVIVVVPFAQQQHETESFGDYWRFTPTCLRQLFAENRLTVVYEAESPDADAATYLLFVGSREPDRWRQTLPTTSPIREAGRWIGRPRVWNLATLALGLLLLAQLLGWLGRAPG